MLNQHKKFPKIRGYHNIVKEIRAFCDDGIYPTQSFRPKIKQHGTNSAVRITSDGQVFAQKRNSDCHVTGHFNFPMWVKGNEQYFSSLANPESTIIIDGEWAGQDIQKKVAVSEIEKSMFIFSIRIYTPTDNLDEDGKVIYNSKMIIEPSEIEEMVNKDGKPENLYIIPWYSSAIEIDFNKQSQVKSCADDFNAIVEVIDKCDPYIKEMFDIEGFGEGLVYYPVESETTFIKPRNFERYAFKVKGASHSARGDGNKKARAATPLPESVHDFVGMMMTNDRMLQGVSEVCGESQPEMKNTGQYIGWICRDVALEGADELLAASLEWKQVQGLVATRAREFFIGKVQEV